MSFKVFVLQIVNSSQNGIGVACHCSSAMNNPFVDFLRIQGFCHRAWARPELTKGSTSVGVVFKRDKFGSMIQVQRRVWGKLFKNKEQAEHHGLELCKDWIDKRP
jgi:hypothetical protein